MGRQDDYEYVYASDIRPGDVLYDHKHHLSQLVTVVGPAPQVHVGHVGVLSFTVLTDCRLEVYHYAVHGKPVCRIVKA